MRISDWSSDVCSSDLFDVAHTSVLKRAVRTLWGVQDEMGLMWLPVVTDWRLNERHYGGLTGLNKAETALKYGEDQVKVWRRSYDIPPPPLDRAANESVHEPPHEKLHPKEQGRSSVRERGGQVG